MSALHPSHTPSPVPAPGRSLAVLAFALGSFFAASSAPTPLYRLYQQDWGFSSGMLTLVFAVYALSLLLALLTTGALSDHLGRKPVMLAALALEIVSLAVFARAGDVHGLVLARVLQGFATGMASAAMGAALLDLHRERGTLVSTMAPMIGMAAGIVVAAEFSQLWRQQLGMVFWLMALLFVAVAAAVAVLPETGSRRHGALAALRPRVRIPRHARADFVRVLPMSLTVWALGGFYLSLGPSMIRSATGSEVAASFAVCINTLSAAAAIWTLRSRAPRAMLQWGGSGLLAGVALLLIGAHLQSLALVLGASVVAGAGFGVGFQGALRTVIPRAEPHERGALISAVYIASYLAFSMPAIAAGAAASRFGLLPVTYAYGLMLMAFAALALAGTRAGAASAPARTSEAPQPAPRPCSR
ncbi:Inner membrane transport protein yajR [Delftia tsuruhatensis]|uniref:MFS transporter n=1 Tax=Delftia tsuruhatensis TaxID=180282 RepID=UPI001E6CA380|nr:MFS transporter [Delftia tsuruhatensis]CAB5686806.1 Inner membrane transport protein yajR [Delftia tsuruhatensis]CAC9690511.1 Inner membrane transport protein yajR [Delftia tsuruhatensis]